MTYRDLLCVCSHWDRLVTAERLLDLDISDLEIRGL